MNVTTWFMNNLQQLLISALVLALYYLISRFIKPRIEQGGEQTNLQRGAVQTAIHAARLLSGIVVILVIIIIWNVDLHAIVVSMTTAITLLGVALFASWSILSNITAYFILLMKPSFRRGNFVRIIDTDNYIEGYIADLTLFNSRLITENREVVIYPNNLLLARPMIVNPRNHLQGVGKIGAPEQEPRP